MEYPGSGINNVAPEAFSKSHDRFHPGLRHIEIAQRTAYHCGQNRIALNAGWDEELLKLELEALQMDDFDLELLGFDPAEIDDLLFGYRGIREAVLRSFLTMHGPSVKRFSRQPKILK